MSDDFSIDEIVLSGLIRDKEYREKVFHYLKGEYFQDSVSGLIFNSLVSYFSKFKEPPTQTELIVEIESSSQSIDESATIKKRIKGLWKVQLPSERGWLIEKTEKFCRDQAIYNAIIKSIAIYDGSDTKHSPLIIPELLKEAVEVSFDSHIGMDFFSDAVARFDYYSNPESKIPFSINVLNEITNGGVTTKTLSILVGGTNIGKSMALISLAADYIRQGIDVLYITMEMREEEIFRRVEANLLDIAVNDVGKMDRKEFINSIVDLKKKSLGKMKVKEFPPGAASSAHFNHLMNELAAKKSFFPKVVLVDYLGIIDSSRIKVGSTGSYFYLKAASEELRALAVEKDVSCWSAMQVNRQGFASSDFDLSDISESMGVAHTADLMLGLIRTEQLDAEGKILIKQLKNRFANKTVSQRFLLGVELEKQRLFGISDRSLQDTLVKERSNMETVTSKSIKSKFASLGES